MALETDCGPLPTDEVSYDPADWDAFRALAHRMVDDTLDQLQSLGRQAPWTEPPALTRAALTGDPLPLDGIGEAAAYDAFRTHVQPYANGNRHPRFWGWVQGNGTPLAMMAELLAAGMNPHLAGFNQSPALVEHQVLRWLAQLLDFPATSGGLLVSSGTLANLLGLAVARHAGAQRHGFDVRADGVHGGPRLVCYGSAEVHTWARKAVEVLGLGASALRLVPVGDDDRLSLPQLERMIAADRAAGLAPFCVIGTAGTVNTGASDDLVQLAHLCRGEQLWFHVDGAFGALAYISPALRDTVRGLEQADSIGFDLHKWGSLPFECACTLVRDVEAQRAAFAMTASYLTASERGVIAGGIPFAERGIDLTRGFRALKVWLSLKAYGVNRLRALIEQNVEHACRLGARIDAEPALELLAPVHLNIVCFRYAPAGLDDASLDALNQKILLRLQERGIAVPSGTRVRGRFAIRVANVNHRSTWNDFEMLLRGVLELGDELVQEQLVPRQRAIQ